jgi:UDP-N-acetylmuramoyl-L-alanyl-D-glutamate--2,6-diaminopimelate ligase
MMLSELLKNCPVVRLHAFEDTDINGLCFDSRQVHPGDAFFALGGVVHDGHQFIDEAMRRGARVVFSERECSLQEGVAGVIVENTRQAMALAAQAYYGDPTRSMTVVGITGTNGKTTISYLLEAVLRQAGLSPAVVGTVNYRYGTKEFPAPHTTPESTELLSRIREFKLAGARSLALEVSSHALEQFRTDGIHFRVGVFSNLTPEHLDYHPDMESYFRSKCRLFLELLKKDAGKAVINCDDPYGARLAKLVPEALTCGQRCRADIHPVALSATLDGIRGRIATPVGDVKISTRLLGEYNVENLLCCIGACVALGLPVATIEQGLAAAPDVPGRLERIENDRGAVILVDYAHTGDALQRVLAAMKSLAPQRLITVFGCGGDRDRSKRPVMGEVAARFSDLAVATSDNPRTEDPRHILADVRTGLNRVHSCEMTMQQARQGEESGYVVIPERRAAIGFAVSILRPGDLLLIAGKGHEDYQILGTDKIHFDDREEVRLALQPGGAK